MTPASRLAVRPARDAGEVRKAYECAVTVYEAHAPGSRDRILGTLRLDPPRAPEDVIVAVEHGSIVGMVRIADRTLRWNGHGLQTGGVTSVAVKSSRQRKGLGRRLMERALERCSERGDVLSYLFARRAVDGYYPRLGYVGIAAHTEMEIPPGAPAKPARIRTGPTAHVAALARAYEDSYRMLPLSVRRGPPWWKNLGRWLALRGPPSNLRRYYAGDRFIGYTLHQGDQIVEAAAAKSHQDAFADAVTTGKGARPAAFRLPLQHWLMARLATQNHTLRVRTSWDGGHMARIIDAQAWKRHTGARSPPLALLDHARNYRALKQLFEAPGAPRPTWGPFDEV